MVNDDRKNAIETRPAFYQAVADVLHAARAKAHRAVNFAMVEAYWHVGRMIVEEEQQGEKRAEYGAALIKNLANRLTGEFGAGFGERELRRMRQFYTLFPIRDALRPELAWTHYRLLIRVEKSERGMVKCENNVNIGFIGVSRFSPHCGENLHGPAFWLQIWVGEPDQIRHTLCDIYFHAPETETPPLGRRRADDTLIGGVNAAKYSAEVPHCQERQYSPRRTDAARN